MKKLWLVLLGLVGVVVVASAAEGEDAGGADVDYRGLNNLPRGMRNNNPGNIKYNSANNWQGQAGSDGTFVVFESYKWGIRAMMKLLTNYMNSGRDTVNLIISKWAPAGSGEGNPTSVYAKAVADDLGVGINDRLAMNEDTLVALVISMAAFENGRWDAVAVPQARQVWREFFEGIAGVAPGRRRPIERNKSYLTL